jgi:hypothetical protein
MGIVTLATTTGKTHLARPRITGALGAANHQHFQAGLSLAQNQRNGRLATEWPPPATLRAMLRQSLLNIG